MLCSKCYKVHNRIEDLLTMQMEGLHRHIWRTGKLPPLKSKGDK